MRLSGESRVELRGGAVSRRRDLGLIFSSAVIEPGDRVVFLRRIVRC